MTDKIWRFGFSAFLYWFIASFSGKILEIPENVIIFASFVPPVLGLMCCIRSICWIIRRFTARLRFLVYRT